MNRYLKFLQYKHELDDAFIEKYAIDQRCLKFLEIIATSELNSMPMTITQLMHEHQFGSPATIHRSLKKLRNSNLLIFLHKETNYRTKYPSLINESKIYFESTSRLLLKSL